MADSWSHTAVLLLPSFPTPEVYKSPSGKRGAAKDGTQWGQGWISTPLLQELTKESHQGGSITAGGSECRRGRAAVTAPLVLPTEPIPALLLPSQAVQQPWSSDWSQSPWWSFRQLGQLWLSPRGTRFPMTHSPGRGEIIGTVAKVALSVREHTQAGAGQGWGQQGLPRCLLQAGHGEGASCCCASCPCCLQLPCSMDMAPLERVGSTACRETGSRGTGWQSAGSAAPAELRVHRVAALGKSDEILPHHPKPLNPYNVPGHDGAHLFQGEGGRLLLHLAWLGAVMASTAHSCHSFQSDSSMCHRALGYPWLFPSTESRVTTPGWDEMHVFSPRLQEFDA